ncbi:DUF465 domain-containing protein [Sphingomonas lacunae]|uniref:DUF465 domain-containing protein n=1 Tax=Sphingomonas lacunae TaxID=2698828 RepID=A0A6M4AX59_9SPHN|nr:DUF465 domain-containing protein [Sphingomonas lacunae]QJQ33366.1 DUF465 domain-containing protein [Sphingomonas lacunae]
MSHVPHDLHAEFPQDAEVLHSLKTGNSHFAALAERYHGVNREIHRIDSGVEAASDDHVEQLKRQRLAMLDEVSAMIAKARQP